MSEFMSDLGPVKIHKNLIAQIAETAALEVEGVSDLAVTPDKLISKVLHKLNITGINIDLTKIPRIEIPILVKYGYNILDVSTQVQEAVSQALLNTLNIDAAQIVVKIKGLDIPEKGAK